MEDPLPTGDDIQTDIGDDTKIATRPGGRSKLPYIVVAFILLLTIVGAFRAPLLLLRVSLIVCVTLIILIIFFKLWKLLSKLWNLLSHSPALTRLAHSGSIIVAILTFPVRVVMAILGVVFSGNNKKHEGERGRRKLGGKQNGDDEREL